MKKWLSFALLIALFAAGCGKKKVPIVARDITITPKNAVTRLVLDSTQVEQFILKQQLSDSAAQHLRNFYNSRNFQFAWLGESGLTEQARVFYGLNKDYVADFRDSTLLSPSLSEKMELLMHQDTTFRKVDTSMVQLELKLSEQFFNYVSRAYAGKVDPEALQWHIPRKKVNAVALLDSLMSGKQKNVAQWEPVNQQYRLMKIALGRYYSLEKQGPQEIITLGKKKNYKYGDTGLTVRLVRKRLAALGDSLLADSVPAFDSTLLAAVKRTQKRFGYRSSGVIDGTLLRELNIPLQQRIEKLLINLERMRWMPAMPEGRKILVNIPEYRLHVLEGREETLSMGIVVGKAANKTVIFSNKLRNIVFNPYWNVPASIVRAEILPAMQRNKNFLARKNMEQTGMSGGLPQIRQKPGDDNSLGRVKFLFPNSYDIYFHDTPAKSLFSQQKRAFSHGCIRLAQPAKLAAYLLSGKKAWTPEKIATAMKGTKEQWLSLEKPVPVFITYFTAWIDADGQLNFRDDIYGHDQKMAAQLFENHAGGLAKIKPDTVKEKPAVLVKEDTVHVAKDTVKQAEKLAK